MRSKKLICLVLSIVLIIGSAVASFVVFANDSGDGYEYSALNQTLTILSDNAMVDKTEDSYTENPWSEHLASIEHIVVQEGVTKISSFAFCKMEKLEDVQIPNSVASIGEGAFAESALKEITISNNVSSIGDNAFGTNEDFVCNCEVNSYAQNWCLKNYVAFNTPFDGQVQTASINKAGSRVYWSVVPLTDCNVSFLADGRYDTVGYIFDAETYTYSTSELAMRKSAVEYNDDANNDELNFAINTTLKAGKRYYLSTALKSTTKTGSYTVNFNQACSSHIYSPTGIELNSLNKNKSLVKAKCIGCSSQTSIDFGEAVIKQTSYCDVNNDGKVNAKDYAIILHK